MRRIDRGILLRSLLIAFACCAPLVSSPAAADDAASKEATIRRLIEVTRAAEMGAQMRDAMFAQFKHAFPTVPDAMWDELAATLGTEELTELIVPIYEKHFALEDLQALLAFYESPTGRKLLSRMPAVMQESISAGNAWGRRKAEEVLKKLEARGYEPVET